MLEINIMIKKTLSQIKKERMLIDKIVDANERGDNLSFEALKDMFHSVAFKTDSLVERLLSQCPPNILIDRILDDAKKDNEETFDKFTLANMIKNKVAEDIGKKMFSINAASFEEEHNRYMYLVYIWYLRNKEMNPRFKKSIHRMMTLKATNSSTLRKLFSGEYDAAQEISDPSKSFGVGTDYIANEAYYSLLNDLINTSNCTEMFEGFLTDKEVFEAKKKMMVLEFTALCSQMVDRKISFPVTEKPISDFTNELLTEASKLTNEYKEKGNTFPRKVIRL